MVFHDIGFLFIFFELDGFTMLSFSAGAGFFILTRLLRSIIFGIHLKYFTLLRRMYRDMHHTFLFSTSWRITWMDCIFVLRLPVRPFSGLVGKAASPPLRFLKRSPRLVYYLMGVLEGIPLRIIVHKFPFA